MDIEIVITKTIDTHEVIKELEQFSRARSWDEEDEDIFYNAIGVIYEMEKRIEKLENNIRDLENDREQVKTKPVVLAKDVFHLCRRLNDLFENITGITGAYDIDPRENADVYMNIMRGIIERMEGMQIEKVNKILPQE